jgi:hypothetical protein
LRKCTVQSTERAKIFPEKFFGLKVGLGREEVQGITITLFFIKTETRKRCSKKLARREKESKNRRERRKGAKTK